MKTIAASKFKEICLSLLDNIDDEGIIITKHGIPVAKLTSIQEEYRDLIGSLKNKIVIHGNIFSTGEKWNAES